MADLITVYSSHLLYIGKSCKMAAWRLNLSGTCNSTMCTSVNEDFVDFTPLSETKGNNVGTQTDLSFNNKQRQVKFNSES